MQAGRRFRQDNHRVATHPVALAQAVAIVVAAVLVAWVGTASASPRDRVAADPARGSRRSLSQAPLGLQAAFRTALGVRNGPLGSAFQRGKLTAGDGAPNDNFGYSVAISGQTAVVGAYNKSTQTGAAYVFVRSATAWSQQAELTAADAAPNDRFGYAVAISGSTAVVGAFSKNSATGAAYVFVRSATAWSQQAELTAADGGPGDQFGYSVAIAGQTAVVGAYAKSSYTGAAYVFVRSATAWSQQAELTAADGAGSDQFGISVAISGQTAAVGAPGKNSSTGAAYVFVRTGTAWAQQAELTAADSASDNHFGYSVALSGQTAVVGAPYKSSFRGVAYVFVRSARAWSQQAELTAADNFSNDFLGSSVAISGSTAVVGAPRRNAYIGAAYVFVRSDTAWSQEAELTPADGAGSDQFGSSVAISGSTAAGGAPGKSSITGATYVFVVPSQQAELTAADGAGGDSLGYSVAISGSTAVVGAFARSSSTGTAYVFVRAGKAWSQQAELTAANGASGDEFGYSVAISGSTAVVGALGTSSATGAAYVFVRSGTAWSQQAELTAADGSSGDQFGYSVAIAGQTAVVGAFRKGLYTGAAYVYVRSGTAWSQQAELTAADSASGDGFGYSVAIDGQTAVVGADTKNGHIGAAYVFVRAATAWSQQAELTAADGGPSYYFGSSVAVSGSTAVVGAPGRGTQMGAAYVFVRSGTAWSQQAQLIAADGAFGDQFGISVAISGSTAVVGAYGKNSNTGAAYVFVRSAKAWSQQALLIAADGASGDQFGYSVAIAGSTAVVGAYGKSSQTGAAYVFASV